MRHVAACGKLLADVLKQHVADHARPAARQFEQSALQPYVLPARDVIGKPCGEKPSQRVGEPVARRAYEHIGWRALQHGDMRGLIGQVWHQRHRRRAAADDDDPFAGVVQLFRPELRMDDVTGKRVLICKTGSIGCVVIVIAAAHEQEIALDDRMRTIVLQHRDAPACARTRPAGGKHFMAEPDMRLQIVLGDGVVQIAEDRRTVGDRFWIEPGFEAVAERVHVAVRPNPGIAEQIPGSARLLPLFEERECLVRAYFAQMYRHADTRNSGPDNQHIDIIRRRDMSHNPLHRGALSPPFPSGRLQLTDMVANSNAGGEPGTQQ